MSDFVNIINNVKEELSLSGDTEGLCYYAANNVNFDLDSINVFSLVFNIRDMMVADYDHYFALAKMDDYYLIDLTFEQFDEKAGHELRFFDNWPALELQNSLEGKRIYNNLVNDGYSLITNEDFSLYLKSFNPEFECFFTLDDIMPSKVR